MTWSDVLTQLFGGAHDVRADADFLSGTATFDGQPLTVVGTTHHAPIGFALALRQARVVLDTVAQHPGRAILLLIDTQGQQLRRHAPRHTSALRRFSGQALMSPTGRLRRDPDRLGRVAPSRVSED